MYLKILTLAFAFNIVLAGCLGSPTSTTTGADRKVYQGDLKHVYNGQTYYATDTIPNLMTCAGFNIFLSDSASFPHSSIPSPSLYQIDAQNRTDGQFVFHSSVSDHFYRVITSGCQ